MLLRDLLELKSGKSHAVTVIKIVASCAKHLGMKGDAVGIPRTRKLLGLFVIPYVLLIYESVHDVAYLSSNLMAVFTCSALAVSLLSVGVVWERWPSIACATDSVRSCHSRC